MNKQFAVAAAVGMAAVASQAAYTTTFRPETWEFEVVEVFHWVNRGPGDEYPTVNVGITLGTEECPDGAVDLHFETWPDVELDEYTNACPDGLTYLPYGEDMVDLLAHIVESRLDHGFNTDDANWMVTTMSKEDFWTWIFAADNAGKEELYHRDRYYANLPVVGG